MSAGERLAEYVHESQFDGFPTVVIERAKELILDSVGCALGATQTDIGRSYINLAMDLAGKAESTVAGSGMRISALHAAYVNTQLANLLDFDDTYDVYHPGHPGCLIVQSALAMAEAIGATGEELLTSVILGYEVSLRVGHAVGSLLWKIGLPSLAKSIGPAVATGKLLGLDRGAVKNTFDILTAVSGLGAGVPVRRKWDIGASSVTGSVKGNRGVASVEGILAAWQAKHGFSGRTGLLDLDPRDWYLADLPVQGYEDLTKGLGETYRIMDVSFKPTPSCRWTHVPITAAWQALEDQPIKAQDISQIVIRGVERLKRYEWQTMLDAQFSIPCALALAITGAQPGPGWYTTGRFRDEDIRELASKVTYERDREAEALEIEQGKMVCEVNITLKDGQVKTAHADRIKGAPDNPMSRDEILAKFRANLSFADDVWIAKALDMVMNLGGVPDTTVLVEQLY